MSAALPQLAEKAAGGASAPPPTPPAVNGKAPSTSSSDVAAVQSSSASPSSSCSSEPERVPPTFPEPLRVGADAPCEVTVTVSGRESVQDSARVVGVAKAAPMEEEDDVVEEGEVEAAKGGGEPAPEAPTDDAPAPTAPLPPLPPLVPSIVLHPMEASGESEGGEEAGAEVGQEKEGQEPRSPPPALPPLKLRPPSGANGAAAGDPDTVSPARKSPVTVQEWVDSLPVALTRSEEETDEQLLEEGDEALDLGLGAEAGLLYNAAPAVAGISPQQLRPAPSADAKLLRRDGLAREPSVQSDVTSHGSHGSSVESYLESRKPDPEEVLLSLGFGGPASSLDSEVTRIPRRFLQPSKVKGVAIQDFLRHQQELIENFETGFCGYRGLTGSSHSMPSVIVAKIMEKLREHERESIHSAATSEYASFGTTPEFGRRFSHHSGHHHHHHRHLLKRGSAASSPPTPNRQTATLSVLNADNRRFLESQGSKSPEVPRKRMIIGQRSFTFGRDGDLIEVEQRATADASSGPMPLPPLKPLVHKDSVLSSATDLSLTSVDSDSDTDDRSESYNIQRRLRPVNSSSPLVDVGHMHTSTPYSNGHILSTNPPDHSESDPVKPCMGRTPQRPIGIGKRMSSTSLSSWESDTNSSNNLSNSLHDSSFSKAKFSVGDGETRDEYRHKSSHSLLGNLSMRYESIEEDVEMRTESDMSKESSFPLESSSDDSKSNEAPILNRDFDDSVFVTSPTSCPPPKTPVNEGTQSRRGSLQRQQNVEEEEDLEAYPSSLPSLEKVLEVEDFNVSALETTEQTELFKREENIQSGEMCVDENVIISLSESDFNIVDHVEGNAMEAQAVGETRDVILIDLTEEVVCKTDIGRSPVAETMDSDAEAAAVCPPQEGAQFRCVNVPAQLQVVRDVRGDSFEMEEIGNADDEGRQVTLSRARSDSSGFLEGDLDRSPSDNSVSRDWERQQDNEESHSAPEESLLDSVRNALSNGAPRLRGGSTGTVVADRECIIGNRPELSSLTKRLSLPVVCVMDESGGVLLSRSNSLHSISSNDTNSTNASENSERNHRRHRTCRIHSAPDALALTSSCSSVSNMFSSCSDESVIHVDLQSQLSPDQITPGDVTSSLRSNRDLQELLEELAERGVNLPQDLDSLSSHLESQCTPLQADAVRAALDTYSSQLGEGMSSLQAHPYLLECGAEAQRDLQIVKDIREQIAAELRRVATLLEEQPGPRAIAITRQMTILLREQTRLCRQLEALSNGSMNSPLPLDADPIPRTLSASTSASTPVPCCNSERLLGAVREENRRLERLVQGHSQELAEIRHLLRELVSKQS